MKEHKGYEITEHTDGTFSTHCRYHRANGEMAWKQPGGKTLEEITGKIDTFIAECQQKDREYGEQLETLTKQTLETAHQVEEGIKSSRDKAIETLNHAIKCGGLLIQIKKLLPHGKWGEWQTEHSSVLSERTIQRYTKLAKKLGNSPHVADVKSLRQAYLLTGIITEPKKENVGGSATPAKTAPAVSNPQTPPAEQAEETDVIADLPLPDLIEGVIERLELEIQAAISDGGNGSEVLEQLKPLADWIREKAEQTGKKKKRGRPSKLARLATVPSINVPALADETQRSPEPAEENQPQFKCNSCEETFDDDEETVALYECGECGTHFTRETSANDNRQCPDCNKFGRKVSDSGCPSCNEGELEQITGNETAPSLADAA